MQRPFATFYPQGVGQQEATPIDVRARRRALQTEGTGRRKPFTVCNKAGPSLPALPEGEVKQSQPNEKCPAPPDNQDMGKRKEGVRG